MRIASVSYIFAKNLVQFLRCSQNDLTGLWFMLNDRGSENKQPIEKKIVIEIETLPYPSKFQKSLQNFSNFKEYSIISKIY